MLHQTHLRRQQLPPGDKRLAWLLLEAPALPQPAVSDLLRELLRAGPEWATAALSTVLSAITQRCPDRCASQGLCRVGQLCHRVMSAQSECSTSVFNRRA